jgi:predicted PurR-regulated permease PerM
MTRFLKHCSFPYVSSTLVATLISLAATVLVVPMIVTSQPLVEQSSTLSHDSHFYRLSPIPAGADWARS